MSGGWSKIDKLKPISRFGNTKVKQMIGQSSLSMSIYTAQTLADGRDWTWEGFLYSILGGVGAGATYMSSTKSALLFTGQLEISKLLHNIGRVSQGMVPMHIR